MKVETQRPRAAYALLERRATYAVAGLLLALSAVAWVRTVGQAREMADMLPGLTGIADAMPDMLAASAFLPMWIVMMTGMMLPTVAPVVLAHRMVVRKRGEGAAPTVAFVAGYLLVWSAIGLVPLAALTWFRNAAVGDPGWLTMTAGVAVAGAGVYQLTPFKRACLKVCRSPLSFVISHDFGAGWPGALRAGVSHGAWCLGCCWALMVVLVVVGLMNLVWMAGIAAVFMTEKHWARAEWLARGIGVALIGLGAAMAVWPSVARTVSGG